MSEHGLESLTEFENIQFYFEVLEVELSREDFCNFYTLTSSFEQILISIETLISQDTNFHHRDCSCNCFEKIRNLFPWIITKERQIQDIIKREVQTGEECWLIQMRSKYTLLRMWFQRTQ